MKDVLVIEPFYGGSHAQLVDLLCCDDLIGSRIQLYTLPAKKWHWRARTSALYFSQIIESSADYRLFFCSSVLNLAELVSLRPDLGRLLKIVYFHENQLIYPVRKQQDRDFHYGYCQILTTMVADEVVFNSKYNKESFLDSIASHLKLIPDHRPKQLAEQIRPKCRVIYFPLNFTDAHHTQPSSSMTRKQKRDNLYQEHSDRQSFINQPFQDKPEDDSLLSNQDVINSSQDESLLSPHMKSPNHDLSNTCCNGAKGAIKCDSQSFSKPTLKCSLHAMEGDSIDLSTSLHLDNIEKQKPAPNFYIDCGSTDSELCAKKNIDSLSDTEYKKKTTKFPHLHKTILPCGNFPLHIVWPHRWEHDKGPQAFFDALFQLQENTSDFIVSVIGESFSQIPDIFETAKSRLQRRIHAWGYQNREDYLNILKSAHVVVSTADHEFFGVSMLEATNLGCYPLCPKRLVYPEIYPDECLYSTQAQLVKRLRQFCRQPDKIKSPKEKINMAQFSWELLKEEYRWLLLRTN